MEIEIEYEDEHEIECPYCHKKKRHVVKGVAYGEIEPPGRDEP